MTKKISKKPNMVNTDVIENRIKELNMNSVDVALLVNMDAVRFKRCLKFYPRFQFSDKEIVNVALKLKIKIKDLINVKEDAERLYEMKRQELISIEYQTYNRKFHAYEEPKLPSNEKYKSPVEIVRYPKKKYDPMKAKPLPMPCDDPNKVYEINRLGMKILVEENRCGVYCKYVTE